MPNNEYFPLIECEDQDIKYYVMFYDIKHNLNKIIITKEVFLQLFGVHKMKIINGEKRYFIEYEDEVSMSKIELTLNEYRKFRSFKSYNIKNKNIYDRYIEHSEQTDETVYKRMVDKPEQVEDIVYKKMLGEEITKALNTLNETQRKRFIMYYLDDMTYEEIAIKEKCSKQAIKYSIDIAKKHLREKLKKFYF